MASCGMTARNRGIGVDVVACAPRDEASSSMCLRGIAARRRNKRVFSIVAACVIFMAIMWHGVDNIVGVKKKKRSV